MSKTSSSKAMVDNGTVRVWDWPTRLFHWLLVACIFFAWASFEFAGKIGDPTLKWHRWNGYAILVLVVFRLIWGLVGSSTARLSTLMRPPQVTLQYAIDTLWGRAGSYLGHNPLGACMIIVLLAAVLTQGVLGLYTLEHNEITAGPLKRTISDALTERVSWLHVRGFKLILALVAIHVLANSLYQLFKRDPLIKAMITGR
ncbi:MAG: cytochrome b/b6 domain-containing protein, partial [Bosea sp. (in: a-proteobacteria)]